MTLDEWRNANGLSYSEVARRLDVSPEAARRYCTEKRTPRSRILIRIRAITGGKVSADDFLPRGVDDLL